MTVRTDRLADLGEDSWRYIYAISLAWLVIAVILWRKLPEAREILNDPNLNLVFNGKMILAGEDRIAIPDGSEIGLLAFVSGG